MSGGKFEWDLSDSQHQAEYVLDEVIDEESAVEDVEKIANQASVLHELQRGKLIEGATTGRELPRLLYISNDLNFLQADSQARQQLLGVSDQFNEIHIIVTIPLRLNKKESLRLTKNVWLYTTGHIYWWQIPLRLAGLANEQLVFNDGFHPDFIVVDNPYESGYGAYHLANKYHRPLQIHVKEPFWTKEFLQRDKHNKWRKRIANFLLNRCFSVRTVTDDVRAYIAESYPTVGDLSLLPRHFDMESFKQQASEVSKHTSIFAQYSFVMLYVGDLDFKSSLYRVIDAARGLLKNVSVALVVVGEGKAKKEFVERAKILGVDRQVIFAPATTDISTYLNMSDVVVVSDVDAKSEELVVQAALVGLPIVAARTQIREDLFTDGDNAFLCDPTDTVEFSQKLTKLLNTPNLRTQFSNYTKLLVEQRFHQEPDAYKKAYANSLLGAFTVNSN